MMEVAEATATFVSAVFPTTEVVGTGVVGTGGMGTGVMGIGVVGMGVVGIGGMGMGVVGTGVVGIERRENKHGRIFNNFFRGCHMGITIHYRGRINQTKRVEDLTEELTDFANALGWGTRVWTEDWSKPNTARIQKRPGMAEIIGHLPLRGITLFPHTDCESVSFTFESQGCLIDPVGMAMVAEGGYPPENAWVSTKTQFAPIEIHVAIVKLLQHLKRRYMKNLEVNDEGGYWQSEDIAELGRKFDVINEAMDRLEDGLLLHAHEIKLAKTTDQLVSAIERIFSQLPPGEP